MDKEQENKSVKDSQIESTEHSIDTNSDYYEGFSPLDEPVKEREYTKPNIDTSQLESELEEPSFEAPSFSDFDEPTEEEPKSFNPAIENLDKKEQMYATEQMVDTVLDVYGKAHILANKATKIKEKKIADAMQEGEIDPNLRVPVDEHGNSLGLLEYVQEYNAQLSDAIRLEEDFVEKVRPPMIRVFQKKGLAMTDEQFLMVSFGTDIVTKGAMIFQLVRQNKQLIEMWKEQSNGYTPPKKKSSGAKRPTPSREPEPEPDPQPKNTQPETKEEAYQEPEEFTAESMVSDMMGMKETSNFTPAPQDDSLPKFGDPEMLSKIDAVSRSSEGKVIDVTPTSEKKETKKPKKRGRPRKKK